MGPRDKENEHNKPSTGNDGSSISWVRGVLAILSGALIPFLIPIANRWLDISEKVQLEAIKANAADLERIRHDLNSTNRKVYILEKERDDLAVVVKACALEKAELLECQGKIKELKK